MRKLKVIDPTKVLFFDVETVSEYPDFEQLDEGLKPLFKKKGKSILRAWDSDVSEEEISAVYSDRAGIFAEFGKIVVVSVGYFHQGKDGHKFRVTSYKSRSEVEVLQSLEVILNEHFHKPEEHFLCGHNIKEFDIPYVCRRLMINKMQIPNIIDLAGKKPWETAYLLDTMELWKFGDHKNYTSLDLLAQVLQVPTPKDDITGQDVGRVFWEENDLDRIAKYCEKDVVTVARLFQRMRGEEIINEENILFID